MRRSTPLRSAGIQECTSEGSACLLEGLDQDVLDLIFTHLGARDLISCDATSKLLAICSILWLNSIHLVAVHESYTENSMAPHVTKLFECLHFDKTQHIDIKRLAIAIASPKTYVGYIIAAMCCNDTHMFLKYVRKQPQLLLNQACGADMSVSYMSKNRVRIGTNNADTFRTVATQIESADTHYGICRYPDLRSDGVGTKTTRFMMNTCEVTITLDPRGYMHTQPELSFSLMEYLLFVCPCPSSSEDGARTRRRTRTKTAKEVFKHAFEYKIESKRMMPPYSPPNKPSALSLVGTARGPDEENPILYHCDDLFLPPQWCSVLPHLPGSTMSHIHIPDAVFSLARFQHCVGHITMVVKLDNNGDDNEYRLLSDAY